MGSAGSPAITPERITQMAWGFAAPLMLEAAVRHGILEQLDKGPKSLDEVAAATGTSKRGLRPLLTTLASMQLLTRNQEGRDGLAPDIAAFLVKGKPGYMGGFLHHTTNQLIPRWLKIADVVRDGRPAAGGVSQEQTGADFFVDFVEDLFPLSYGAAQALARELGVADARKPVRVLDIATGSGVWGVALAQASPQVHVTALDWPAVLNVTRRVAERNRVANQFTFQEGDLRTADFGSGYDIATLGHILHAEGEVQSRSLLRRVFNAVAPGGSIAIQEFLVEPDRSGPTVGLVFAMNMAVATEEGDTFSFEEIASWLRDAGFENPRTLNTPGPSPLILANRPR
jgi:ubiquinone/menaquinone biosynthesis C-methylase UbiE